MNSQNDVVSALASITAWILNTIGTGLPDGRSGPLAWLLPLPLYELLVIEPLPQPDATRRETVTKRDRFRPACTPRAGLVRHGIMRKFLPAVAAVAATSVLAACHSGTSASAPASSAPATRAVSSASPKVPAAATVTAAAACKALALWENGSSSETVSEDTELQRTFADTTQPVSGAFATWVSDIKAGSPDVSADGALVSLDCTVEGVTVFPSDSSSAAPPAPAASAPAGTASQVQALAAAESYLGDGQGFSRQGLTDQLDSPDGNSFPVADATWAVDHSDANWDDQAVDCAKGYMSDGQGFSRQGLIDQMTSAYGNKFTEAQAEFAATAVGL